MFSIVIVFITGLGFWGIIMRIKYFLYIYWFLFMSFLRDTRSFSYIVAADIIVFESRWFPWFFLCLFFPPPFLFFTVVFLWGFLCGWDSFFPFFSCLSPKFYFVKLHNVHVQCYIATRTRQKTALRISYSNLNFDITTTTFFSTEYRILTSLLM